MTRAVHMGRMHHRVGKPRGFTTCGQVAWSQNSTEKEDLVTCKRCLKLIGAQQPSAPSTAPASPAEPVERRATVGGGETAPIAEQSTLEELFPEATARAYQSSRLARLELLLREIVEAWDRAKTNRTMGTVWRTQQLESAIESARSEIKP